MRTCKARGMLRSSPFTNIGMFFSKPFVSGVLSLGLLSSWAAPVNPQPFLLAQDPPSVQAMTSKDVIERLFTTQPLQANWFAPIFLNQVPVAQVQQIITDLQNQLGNYQGVTLEGKAYRVVFERGSVPTQIVLDTEGRIAGLLFQSPRSKPIPLTAATEAFKALPGQVSFVVLEGSSQRAALNATAPLAVGSAFKLAVLAALKSQIALGQHTWSEVVKLQPGWKSLPSGFLQTWPQGSPLTLHTLAALTISQSDNTATDGLIGIVGREAIEAVAPRNRPFLKTREAFILKSAEQGELRRRFLAAEEGERREILAEVAKLPLPEGSEGTNPRALEVEWFFSTQELCTLIEQVADLPLMRINPGVADARAWERVAFKGGSEPGVLNLTTWLQASNGKTYCVAATWNNREPLDEAQFMALYSGMIEGLQP